MNLPNFKDILKIVLEKLSVLKSNVPVMISIIIVIVAVLLFIPTQLLSNGLKKQMEQESISKLLSPVERLKPIGEEKLEEAQALLDDVVKEANSISKLSIQTTQRELLKYDIFQLDPNDPNVSISATIFYEFGKEYCGRIDRFIEENNANIAPTAEEIEQKLEDAGIESILQAGGGRMGGYEATMEEDIQGMMIEQICQERAEQTFVYIDPYQISGYSFWSQYQYYKWSEDVELCWYSQLGYWVTEDIFDTIAAMNKGHDSLVNAPVKRLMKISFSDEISTTGGGNVTGTDIAMYIDKPKYVLETEGVPKMTPTGRYCDDDYDVIHFKAKFVVDAKDLVNLCKELCSEKEHVYIDKSGQTHTYKHNQITILEMDIRSIDMKSEDHQLYMYGDENVLQVELTCEYLFTFKGYEEYMPLSIMDLVKPVTY